MSTKRHLSSKSEPNSDEFWWSFIWTCWGAPEPELSQQMKQQQQQKSWCMHDEISEASTCFIHHHRQSSAFISAPLLYPANSWNGIHLHNSPWPALSGYVTQSKHAALLPQGSLQPPAARINVWFGGRVSAVNRALCFHSWRGLSVKDQRTRRLMRCSLRSPSWSWSDVTWRDQFRSARDTARYR